MRVLLKTFAPLANSRRKPRAPEPPGLSRERGEVCYDSTGRPAIRVRSNDRLTESVERRPQRHWMAPRPFWKGYLKLSLVTCPVAMTPATSETEKVRFHTLNRKTGNRVVSRYVDAESGRPIEEGDEVKGYASGESSFVLLED